MNHLCNTCDLAYRQEIAPRYIARGTFTVKITRKSPCSLIQCKCNSWGFPLCLACALQTQVCQKCYQPLPCDPARLEAIAQYRQLLNEAIAGAGLQFTQTTASIAGDIARFQEAMQAAEEVYLAATDEALTNFSEVEEATRLASARLWRKESNRNRRRYQAAEKKRKRADSQCRVVFDQAMAARRDARRVAIAAFPQYAIYEKACADQNAAIEQARAAFLAQVESTQSGAVSA